MKSVYKRILKIFAISLVGVFACVLLLMYLIPKIYNDEIRKEVGVVLSDNIKGDVYFDQIELSFYKKFPYLTANINSPLIEGVSIDSLFTEKLFEAESINLGVNFLNLFGGKLSFDKIYVDDPTIFIYVNEEGLANYDIFKVTDDKDTSDDSIELKIDQIEIKSANIIYNDLASKVSFVAQDFDYTGTGNMSDDIFDIKSIARIKSFDFNFDGVHYVKEKPILAKLETKVDTKSLTFEFKKNNIRIKELPVDFIGSFGFIENGYDMLFDIKTEKASLEQLFSIVPPEYQGWLDNTKFGGEVEGRFKLIGKYIVRDSLAPNVDFALKVKNGLIQHGTIDKPLESFNLDFEYHLPKLDIQKSQVAINELSFSIDGKQSDISFHSKGLETLEMKGNINSNVDLSLFSKAVGLSGFEMKGDLNLIGDFEGVYSKGIKVTRTLRKVSRDTIITSIPSFNLQGSLHNGYFKLSQLPKAIENVDIDFESSCLNSDYKNIAVNLSNVSLKAMDNYFTGRVYLKNLSNYNVDADVKGNVDLETLREFLPITDIDVKGILKIDSSIKGIYEPNRKRFPIINSDIKLENGFVRLANLPELPIEDIQVNTHLKSKRGSLSDLSIKLLPINFKLAGEPFHLSASLHNLDDLNYNIKSKGVLNIGNIYKVFKIAGLDVRGKVLTDLTLIGSQSDALKGNFEKLKNSGQFTVRNVSIRSEMFPKPLVINQGVFRFFQEQMQFEKFEARYGSSKFRMNGYLTNVINYVVKGDTLKGIFDLESPYMDVDEFMMFSNNKANQSSASSTGTGVVQVPNNINLTFNANANKVKYSEYNLESLLGKLIVNNGAITLEDTKFNLIGTKVSMNGNYKPIGYRSALFDYQISASEFDIQRAYHEITLFREMVSMAKDAYGNVSLDYKLKGELDKNMFPIMKSLEGAGVLSIEDISFKGFKLLGAIANKTDAKSLENGTLSKVDIKSSIKDNVMTIERTKMKMAGFRPRFEGQVSLDGDLNIGFRLGLPPMGLIGIPMRITGNAEDFDIKLGRYKASEVLGQESDEDEEEEGYEIKSVNDPLPEIPEEQNENKTVEIPQNAA